MKTYTTIQDDTWDLIAYKTQGTDANMGEIILCNRELLDTLIFGAGAKVKIPEVKTQVSETAPYWRKI